MKHIVVVEDDRNTLNLITYALRNEQYVIIPVDNYCLAESILKTIKPDVVLIDYFLDGRDASDLLKLTETLYNKRTTVLVMSAFPGLKSKLNEYKIDGFIEKPFSLEELESIIFSTKKY